MFLTSETGDFLIIAIIAVFVIALGLVIYLVLTNKDSKKVQKEEKPNDVKKEEIPQVVEVPNEPVIEEVKEETLDNNFNIVEEAEKRALEEVSSDVKEEISNDQVEEMEETNAITNIASVLNEMKKDLDAGKKNEEEIARYEDEEEKNAIISYKELMKYKDVQDKDFVLEEKSKDEIKDLLETNKETVKKFKRSEFISPIFGYNDDSNVTYREIKRPPRKEKTENTELEWESDRILKDLEDSNAEVMDFEEEKDIDDDSTKFLDELVDFRRKLD